MQFIPLILMGSLLYLFMIRPQRRRLADQRALLASVTIGDRVMTTSGLYGVVVSENDDVLVLGVAPGVDLHLARGSVARKLADDAPGAPAVEDLVGVEADSPEALGAGSTVDEATPESDSSDNPGTSGEAA